MATTKNDAPAEKKNEGGSPTASPQKVPDPKTSNQKIPGQKETNPNPPVKKSSGGKIAAIIIIVLVIIIFVAGFIFAMIWGGKRIASTFSRLFKTNFSQLQNGINNQTKSMFEIGIDAEKPMGSAVKQISPVSENQNIPIPSGLDQGTPAPEITETIEHNRVILSWPRITSPLLKGYRVVVSKENMNPEYPADGYLYNITDLTRTHAIIDNSKAYTGGDFGKYLVPGEIYNVSVTAVYSGDVYVSSNYISITYPGSSSGSSAYNNAGDDNSGNINEDADTSDSQSSAEDNSDERPAPEVDGSVEGDHLVIRWNPISNSKLQSYRIVISKDEMNPEYPADGYLYNITDKNRYFAVIDNSTPYNGGDFGQHLVPGEIYYLSVTAVYSGNVYISGDSVALTYPESASPVNSDNPPPPTPPGTNPPATPPNNTVNLTAPTLTGRDNGGGSLFLEWSPINSPEFQAYVLSISKNNPTPTYPEDGFAAYITNKSKLYTVVDFSTYNSGSDFGPGLNPGESYYFSVTVLYSNGEKKTSNVVYLALPRIEAEAVAPQEIRGSVEGNHLVIRWDPVTHPTCGGYIVVVSKNDMNPKYPDNGYLYKIYDKTRSSAVIDNSTSYTNGDFGQYLVPGEIYYFSVAAIYSDYPPTQSSAISLTYPEQ